MLDVTDASFDDDVVARSHHEPVLVDVWAPWCGPCRQLGPVLERLSADYHERVRFTKVDSDANPESARRLGVRSIPLVVLFHRGEVVDSFIGVQSEAQVRAFIDRHLPRPGAEQVDAATAARDRGDLQAAARHYQAALALDPGNDGLRGDAVAALAFAGRADAARDAFGPLAAQAAHDAHLGALGLLVDAAIETAGQAPPPRGDGRGNPAGVTEPAEPAERAEPADLAEPADSAEPADLLAAARAHWLAGRWQPAIDALLALVAADRGFGDDIGRRTLVAVLAFCPDPALVAASRRRLAAVLN